MTLLLLASLVVAAPTQQLMFDGDVPWVVPQELRVPSEPKTDVASDNAMMMVWYSYSYLHRNSPHII